MGYWLGTAGDGTSKLIVAPKSTEFSASAWGSYGTVRNTTSTTNGVANTTTLYGFGPSSGGGHPAAYDAKSLTTGGYNSWYLPAKDELNTCWANHLATPFATANAFGTSAYWSSTEGDGYKAWLQNFAGGTQTNFRKDYTEYVRATRRSTV